MPLFIQLSDIDRDIFFQNLKKNINSSWEKFYPKYPISRMMFFNYVSGRNHIPKELFYKWQKISKSSLKAIEIERPKYTLKIIHQIKLDEKLAEIIGVLNGDGHISKSKYEVCVAGNRLERDYFDYLKNLFESKFNTEFKLMEVASGLKLRVYSKELSLFLTNYYGLPKGNKMGKLQIPKVIKDSPSLLVNYLRGLFDTDGTIYLRRKKDVVLEISSADKRFLTEIQKALNSLGFNAKKYEKHVNLYNLEDIKKFFNLIKPSNPKHLNKYQRYSKLSAGGLTV